MAGNYLPENLVFFIVVGIFLFGFANCCSFKFGPPTEIESGAEELKGFDNILKIHGFIKW